MLDPQGYGEAESGLVGRVMENPGMTHGGQTVIISDVSCTRPRAFINHHDMQIMPPGWTKQGRVHHWRTVSKCER
jgi:hypothetical protein